MISSLAFLDWGRWVVDCPECKDARAVYTVLVEDGPLVRQTETTCANGHRFAIVMPDPDEESRIMSAMAERPEAQRSWYPEGHGRAEEAGLVVGQTAEDLERENRAGAEHADAARRERLREMLAAEGIEVGPDGTFEGRL